MSLRAMVRREPVRRTPVERTVDTVVRMAADVRGQVADLDIRGKVADLHIPGKVADLHIPGKVADFDIPGKLIEARRELAARIDPGMPRRRRRRALWIGLLGAALAGGTYAALARLGSEHTFAAIEAGPAGAPISAVPTEPDPVGSPPR
jgi:hypothetical protein